MSSIDVLPNEIIYRVFDHLKFPSILSFSRTCKRFLQCRDGYNQYRLNFQSTSKPTFDSICRFIRPSQIVELTLSDDDNETPGQVQAWLRAFPTEAFPRLNSLSLLELNETHLLDLLTRVQHSPLTALHLHYRQYFGLMNPAALDLLQNTLTLKTLKTLHLDVRSYHSDHVLWSPACAVEHLTLRNLNLHQLICIVSQRNRFQSLTLKNISMKDFDLRSAKTVQLDDLRSFQLEESELFMEKILWLLSATPQLHHWKFEGFTPRVAEIFREHRLETFIQTQLNELKTLRFFVRFSPVEFKINQSLVESLVEQFHRPFWTNELPCTVVGDFICGSNELHFYSTPPPYHSFKYADPSSSSARFRAVYHLDLNLKDLPSSTGSLTVDRLFPNLKHLKLTISDQCPSGCFQSLSTVIRLANVEKLILIISSRGDSGRLDLLINEFLTFLPALPSLASLEMFNRWYGISSLVSLEHFCARIPASVKHLNVDVLDMNEIPTLITHLPHMYSFKFKFSFDKAMFVPNILAWLTAHTVNSSHVSDMHYLAIWMSKPVATRHSAKRMKFTRIVQ